MKIIVAGSRTFNNYLLLKETLDNLDIEITEIVCGEARGADLLGKKYAYEKAIPCKSFYPDWQLYGRRAGFIRNHEMGDYADYLVAFWDGKSRGTKDMITYMNSIGKHGKIVLFDN